MTVDEWRCSDCPEGRPRYCDEVLWNTERFRPVGWERGICRRYMVLQQRTQGARGYAWFLQEYPDVAEWMKELGEEDER